MSFLSDIVKSLGFGISGDILGIYNRPTAYVVKGCPDFYVVPYPLPETDTMKRLGYTVIEDIRVPVYNYPGDLSQIQNATEPQ